MTDGNMRKVPPPAFVPTDVTSIALGLLPGLKASRADEPFQCGHCEKKIDAGEHEVAVPDAAGLARTKEEAIEACRLASRNGSGTYWCLDCARRIGEDADDGPIDQQMGTQSGPTDNNLRKYQIAVLAFAGLTVFNLILVVVVLFFTNWHPGAN